MEFSIGTVVGGSGFIMGSEVAVHEPVSQTSFPALILADQHYFIIADLDFFHNC